MSTKILWKTMLEGESNYQISHNGDIKSFMIPNNPKIMKLRMCDHNGFLRVGLRENGTQKKYYLHVLLRKYFPEIYVTKEQQDNFKRTSHEIVKLLFKIKKLITKVDVSEKQRIKLQNLK